MCLRGICICTVLSDMEAAGSTPLVIRRFPASPSRETTILTVILAPSSYFSLLLDTKQRVKKKNRRTSRDFSWIHAHLEKLILSTFYKLLVLLGPLPHNIQNHGQAFWQNGVWVSKWLKTGSVVQFSIRIPLSFSIGCLETQRNPAGWSSDPQQLCGKLNMTVCICNPNADGAGSRDRHSPGACWPANPANS